MSERRYTDTETAAILRAAAERGELPPKPATDDDKDGMTLAQLQAIGHEVGIPAEAIAQAAAAVDVRGGNATRRFLGLPIGVSRSVDLGRKFSDDDWNRLVVRLRDVFDAYGSTRSDGASREWRNGNLRVMLVPTNSGHQLRFSTYNGGAGVSISAGLFALVTMGAVAGAAAMAGKMTAAMPGIAFLTVIGVGMIANGAFRLPGWARLRGRQMESIAAEVAAVPILPEQVD